MCGEKRREEGLLSRIQKVGGCAECDRMEALGCQRIMWVVHTESTNNTEIVTVEGGIGQENLSSGMRDECALITARQRQPENLALPCTLVGKASRLQMRVVVSRSARCNYPSRK